jgi:hypothetical protein
MLPNRLFEVTFVFFSAELLVTPHRNRLNATKVSKMIFVKLQDPALQLVRDHRTTKRKASQAASFQKLHAKQAKISILAETTSKDGSIVIGDTDDDEDDSDFDPDDLFEDEQTHDNFDDVLDLSKDDNIEGIIESDLEEQAVETGLDTSTNTAPTVRRSARPKKDFNSYLSHHFVLEF